MVINQLDLSEGHEYGAPNKNWTGNSIGIDCQV